MLLHTTSSFPLRALVVALVVCAAPKAKFNCCLFYQQQHRQKVAKTGGAAPRNQNRVRTRLLDQGSSKDSPSYVDAETFWLFPPSSWCTLHTLNWLLIHPLQFMNAFLLARYLGQTGRSSAQRRV